MPARLNIQNRRSTPLSSDEQEIIRQAFLEALCMAEQVEREINTVWNQSGRPRRRRERRRDAWSAHENFVTWFGGSRRHILIRRVRRRIQKLRNWLDQARIGVILHDAGDKHCDETTNAFAVIPRRPLRIHLCPSWFTRDPSRRAAIIIHELVHQLGFGHPDGTTAEGEALQLAIRDSRKARRSPENYEHLYEFYFCKLFIEASESQLGGFFLGSNNGYYYVRQVGDEIFWFGEDPNGSWSNMMVGTLNGDVIRGEFVDLPKGNTSAGDPLTLNVDEARTTISKISGGGNGTIYQSADLPLNLPQANTQRLIVPQDSLTGRWEGNDGGYYYIRQIGSRVFWFGEQVFDLGSRPSFSNVAVGNRDGNTVELRWVDVPKGITTGHGTLTLEVTHSNQLNKIEGAGFGGSQWIRKILI